MAAGNLALDCFFATYADDPSSIVSLQAVKEGREVVVHGQVVNLAAGAVLQPGILQTPPISDWLIEYASGQNVMWMGSIWVCCQSQWYKLLRPAAQYMPVHGPIQRKLDLSTRAVHVLRSRPDLSLEVVKQILLQPASTMPPGMTYTIQDLQAEAGFILGQLAAVAKKLMLCVNGQLPPLIMDMAKLTRPDIAAPILNSLQGGEVRREVLSCLALPEVSHRVSFTPPQHIPGGSDMDSREEQEPEVHRPGRSASRSSYHSVDHYNEQEIAADLKRGPPPPPCTDWRVEPHMVSDLLIVWEMLMSFSHLLQLPPISLQAFEAAILPGPLPLRPSTPVYVPAPPAGRSTDTDSDTDEEEAYWGEGKAPDPPTEPGLKAANNSTAATQYNVRTLLDADGAATAALLRDVHAALLKVIDGFSTKRLPDPPDMGRLGCDDNKTELWQERVAAAIQDSKVPPELLQPGVRDAVDILKFREYYLIPPSLRLGILRTLVDLALNSDVMREYVEKKAELLSGNKPKGGYNLLPADHSEDLPEVDNMRSFTVPALSPMELLDASSWIRWMDGCKIGVRRPIGIDFRNRRYWAFGQRAGCWRIFVEAPESQSWGWYEGQGLAALITWLRAGGLEQEGPLLRALEAMPIPKKYTNAPLPPYPLPLTFPPGSSAPHIPWTLADFRNRRPDGYKLLEAPLLKGDYHRHVPAVDKTVPIQDRVQHCCEAIITDHFDFFKNPDPIWLNNMIHLLNAVKDGTGQQAAQAVLQMEDMLYAAGHTQPAWNAQLRGPWRKSLSRSEAMTHKDIAMHLSALQYHLTEPQHRLTRLAFFRRVQATRCPLYLPKKGEVVIVMRTGALIHLDKYAAMASLYPVDDVIQAREVVRGLRPVERFEVMACGFRSYAATSKESSVPNPQNSTKSEVKSEATGVKQEMDGVHVKPEPTHHHSNPQGPTPTGISVAAATAAAAAGEAGGNPVTSPMQKPMVAQFVNPNRPPCMWMVLRQLQQHDGQEQASNRLIVLPLHIDSTLPDYTVLPDIYETGMAHTWKPGDRFRMYFGGKGGNKVGGMWYRGTIKAHVTPAGQVDSKGSESHDPWDSIIVQWDLDDGNTQTRVNPWEIEVDPDEAKRREEEARKAEEAARRAQRAEAKERRSARMREMLEHELAEAGIESSDDDDSDDTEDDEEFRRVRRQTRKRVPPQQSRGAGRSEPQQRGGGHHATQQAAPINMQAVAQQIQVFTQNYNQIQQQVQQLHAQIQQMQQLGQTQTPVFSQAVAAFQQLQNHQQQNIIPQLRQLMAIQQQLQAQQQQQQQQQQLAAQRIIPTGPANQAVHPHQQQILQQSMQGRSLEEQQQLLRLQQQQQLLAQQQQQAALLQRQQAAAGNVQQGQGLHPHQQQMLQQQMMQRQQQQWPQQ